MSTYVAIKSCPTDHSWWNHDRQGRKVKCPKCGQGVTMFLPILAAACSKCNVSMEVLTDAVTAAAVGRSGATNSTPAAPRRVSNRTPGPSAPKRAPEPVRSAIPPGVKIRTLGVSR